MFDFINLQYIFGNITADEVKAFAPFWISFAEAETIIRRD